jgi:hypothetical protein
MTYRPKPDPFEAFRYYYDPCPEWFCDAQTDGRIVPGPQHCVISTGDGDVRADAGDYIIKDAEGQISAMAAELFEELYEPITL